MQPFTVIFLGPQGCGKGTQLKLLADFLSKKDPARTVLTPAMGSLLRSLAQQESHAALLLRRIMEKGELVEYAVSVPLFGSYLLEHLQDNQHLLIDGFPRSVEQVTFLDSAIRFYSRHEPVIIRIEISDEESLKRLSQRKRADDTPEAIRSRLAWTRKAEAEIETWFRGKPAYRFVEIDGSDTIEQTHQKVLQSLNLA
jgi:adenylate kinase